MAQSKLYIFIQNHQIIYDFRHSVSSSNFANRQVQSTASARNNHWFPYIESRSETLVRKFRPKGSIGGTIIQNWVSKVYMYVRKLYLICDVLNSLCKVEFKSKLKSKKKTLFSHFHIHMYHGVVGFPLSLFLYDAL